ncbi:hypothetical protein Bca4012_052767 [Brassica carinata]
MYNIKLWGTSGHAEKYKKNTFTFDIEKQEAQTYELPWSLLDVPTQGSLIQSFLLFNVVMIAYLFQDDAHIFCTEDQVMDERPGNYLGDLKTWDKAENDLKLALDAFGRKWQLSKGDGAFYGPKIDITVSDAMNRKFQCATLQYSDEDEGKKEKPRPVMIHRAVLGSVERMFAILLEHYKGKWPFWLSPRQAIVCPISKKSEEYALQVKKKKFMKLDTMLMRTCELVVGEIEAATG